ncbi:MAG TPA: TonB-dependent receptor [Prolixibacteraceae bacterium]|nr:TonB-dependent receptor [Prolixibacteraceae bacterium]
MKLTVFLILLSFVQLLAINSYAQKTKLSIDLENTSIEQVLLDIENQSGFKFIYNKEKVNVDTPVSIQLKDKSINETLDALFEGKNVFYTFFGNQVILTNSDSEIILNQQQKPVSGKVTDSAGSPLPGVSVVVKGTTNGTITDSEGKYSLSNVPGTTTLTFSFVGMKMQEVVVGGKTTINITLEEESIGIEEVVAIGYGTMRKSDLTGSITSISSESLEKTNSTSVSRALQGKAAGVRITQRTGRPGEEVTIRVRGGNSLSGGNEPLYVIDGFPVDNLGADFNPEDIASMEILKDASATAIYGSRGSNGVILITTKRGVSGKTQVSYNASYGNQTLRKKLDLLNKDQYVAMQNEVVKVGLDRGALPSTLPNSGSILSASDIAALPYNDWQDLTYQNAPIQSHQLSVSGGNDMAKIYTSLNYVNQDGLIKNSGFSRIGMRVNGDIKMNKKMSVKASVDYANAITHNGNFAKDGNGAIPFQSIVMPPTSPIMDANGKYTVFSGVPWGGTNPVGIMEMDKTTNTLNRILNNVEFQYDIIKGLNLRVSAGIDFINNTYDKYSKIGISNGGPTNGQAIKYMNKSYSFVNENILNYSFDLNKIHRFNLMGGTTYQSYVFDQIRGSSTGFVSDAFEDNNLQSGTKPNPPSSTRSDSKLISYLGRANYAFNNRYMLTLTGRYDGSSKFGKDNKYAFFPSAALAWRASEEDFIKQYDWISNLKVRTSIGKAGNQAIGSYQTLDRLSTNVPVFGNGAQPVGFVSSGFANPGLRWETTQQTDIGIDLGLFENRINLNADYYKKSTTDLLYNATLPPSSGYSSSTRNVGEIQNKGFEFELSYKNIKGAFRSETSLNMAFNRGIVADLGTDNSGNKITRIDSPIEGGNWFPLWLGQTPSQLYGYVIDGIYQTDAEANSKEPGKHAGDYIRKDLNDDGVINGDDQKMLTHLEPKFIFGINQTFSYKNFELAVQIVGTYGNNIANEFNKYYTALGGKWNVTQKAWNNRWTGPGSTGTHASASPSAVDFITFSDPSSLWVEDGSYLRFKDIRLTYNVPKSILSKIKASALSVYVSGTNLITFTNYSHYDPEVQNAAVNGWDRGLYPAMKSVIGGVQITF